MRLKNLEDDDYGYTWNCKKCGAENEFRMTPQEKQEYIDDWEADNQDLVADGETGEGALDNLLLDQGEESGFHYGDKCKNCGTIAENPYGEDVNEAEVSVDNEGNIAGYLATIDEYVEMLFKSAEGTDNNKLTEIAYRIQNAVDDIRTRELGLKPSLIRAKFNEGKYKSDAQRKAVHASKAEKLKEFGPDERYMKIGNNTMIANKKTGSVSSTLSLGGDKSATVNNHLNKDGSAGKIRASGTVNGVKFKASNNINGTAPKASASMRGITINASEEPKVREAGSPWTTTGKHPEKMTTDELWTEIAVFDELQDRGETLSPKDMMRLDSLFSYMDTAEMNEQIKRKADSMMESAVWKAKRNK